VTVEIAMRLSGFLFLFVIITDFVTVTFGNKIISDLDSDAELQKISDDPNKFKKSIVIALIHHFGIIALAVMLFIAFGSYSIILGVVWITFRTGESLILFCNEKNYWGLLNVARQYSGASGAEKNSLSDLARTILKTKQFRWIFAQILFSIGTIAYTILFVTYGVIPPIIGWFGLVASILFGFGSGMILVKPNFKVLGYLGGGLILLFEVVLGGWLIFVHTIP
jgi:hypothetical protein